MKKIFLVVMSALVTLGCEGTRFKVIPVSGKITFIDGKPLPEGTTLTLRPIEGKVGVPTAEVKADGSFQMVHENGGSGAELGKYILLLAAPGGIRQTFPEEHDVPIEVKEGMGPLDIKVKTKKK